MENLLKKVAWILFLTVLLGVSISNVGVVYAAQQFELHGAYWEDGSSAGAINCTLYREGESPYTFELNGTSLVNASISGTVFEFDLGYNESRIYYVYQNETIYVFRPADPYYTYFFEVVDYVGLEWGYLESIINVNGYDRVVERWTLDILNDIPFVFTWGIAYKIRLVCDLGEYTYGSFVAGADTDQLLAITNDLFPTTPTDISDLTVSATRMNESWIRAVYIDAEANTTWVNFDIYEHGNTTAIYSYNTTSNSVILNWYSGASDTDYYVVITISHETLGTKYWTYPCAAPTTAEGNPFTALRILSDSFPFDLAQLPAVCLLVVVFMVACHWVNIPIGIIAGIITAFLLEWLGWLGFGWTWLAVAGCISFILAIAEAKQREPIV